MIVDVERRTVLQVGGLMAVGGLVAACSSSTGTAATSSAIAPASTAAASTAPSPAGTSLAAVADVPVGGGVILQDAALVVTQPSAGEMKAFSAICTHAGCLVGSVVDNEIICPCHDARFSATDGSVLQGPATEPLAESAVSVQGGNVVLDA